MRKKCIYRALIGAAIASGLTCAQTIAPTPPTPAQMAARQVARLTTLLTLTSDQQAQATTLFTAEATASTTLMASMRTARKALTTAIQSDNLDTIATEATAIGNLTAQETEGRAKAQAGFYAILTTDQQTKYKQLLAGGPGGFGGGPGGPGGGPHGGK